ncbi:LGFP repeat-containing protein [Blastococcus fimeti]|nr:LGFP repeat-containing protein [Blastococcus fimeti]
MSFAHRAHRAGVVVLALLAVPVLSPASPARGDDAPGAPVGDTVVGELVQAYAEHAEPGEHADHGPLSWIATEDGGSVRIDTEAAAALPLGATVEVTVGAEVQDEASEELGLAPAYEVLEAEVLAAADAPSVSPAIGPYTNEVTVVLVQTPGTSPDGMTAQRLVDQINGPVAGFWESESNGAVRVHGSAATPDWITTTAGCDNPFALWAEVAAHPLVAFNRGAGRHLLVYVPGYPNQLPGCGYGLAEIGAGRSAGGYLLLRGAETSVMAHELGHNFGLGHSSALQCDGALDSGTCRTRAYYDLYDVMGASWERVGSLNVVQAAQLGVLPSATRVDLTAGGRGQTVTLSPVSGRSGTRAVRLTDAAGRQHWLELRTASGRDSWLGTAASWPGLEAGVLLRRAGTASDSSLLLDGSPSRTGGWDGDVRSALPPGVPSTVAGGDFVVTVQSQTATSAVVAIVTRQDGLSPIAVAQQQAGGSLGPALTPEACGLAGGGCYQVFRYGSIFWSPATGAHVVQGAIATRWTSLGAENGPLGYPVADPTCGLVGGGCAQSFQGGDVSWSATTGARVVSGAVATKWASWGRERGALGYPAMDVACGLAAGGCYQVFQYGTVYYSPVAGTTVAKGGIGHTWMSRGAENGAFGYPVTDEMCGLPAGGCAQEFQHGRISWSVATGARLVTGAVRDRYGALADERGHMGYPITDTACGLVGGGCFQVFQYGWLYWSPATGAYAVKGGIGYTWLVSGAENGPLGYPVSDEACGLVGGGCSTHFHGGSIYWSPATGAGIVGGALRDAWAAEGAEAGSLGYPVGREYAVAGGRAQRFAGGTLTWVRESGAVSRS